MIMEKILFLKKINKKINIEEDNIRPSNIINSTKNLLNRKLSLNQLIEYNDSKNFNQNIYYKHPLQTNNSCFFEKIIKLTNNKKFGFKKIKNNNIKSENSKIYKKKVLSLSFSKSKIPKNNLTLTNNNSNSTINTTINNNLFLINNNESSSCRNSNSKNIKNMMIDKEFKTYSKNNNNKLLSETNFEKINQISLTIKNNKIKHNKNKKYNLEFNYFRNKEKNIKSENKESEEIQLKNQINLKLRCNLENKFNNGNINLFTPKNKRNNNYLDETKKSLTNQSKNNINYKYDFSFNFFKRNNEK